jgi:membrane associated rhomboid family serine protease
MSNARTMPVCYRHPDRPTYLSCSECGRHICPDCSHDAPVGQKCPECVRAAGRQRVVNARTLNAAPSFQTSPVVFSLIAINVVIFLIGLTSRDLELDMLRNYAAWTPAIEAGEWWRGLSAAFLHGGTMHILFNMYFLYIFGPRLERQVGSVAFSGIYLASAAGGSVATYLFGPANTLSVGASGALFGLFGAWLYAAYRQRGSAAGSAMFNQLGAILLINMALPLFIPNIDWRAHLGGLATGIVVAFLWEQIAAGRTNARQMRAVVAFAVLAAMLVGLAVL